MNLLRRRTGGVEFEVLLQVGMAEVTLSIAGQFGHVGGAKERDLPRHRHLQPHRSPGSPCWDASVVCGLGGRGRTAVRFLRCQCTCGRHRAGSHAPATGWWVRPCKQ